jgi:hypothetical protein
MKIIIKLAKSEISPEIDKNNKGFQIFGGLLMPYL